VHVSKFYKEAIEGKYLSNIATDAKTLYETFRKGAKVSSKILNMLRVIWNTGQCTLCQGNLGLAGKFEPGIGINNCTIFYL
jgi:hypothetical protein